MNCPLCSSEMRQRQGTKGMFWGCLRYPQCKGTVNIDPNTPQPKLPPKPWEQPPPKDKNGMTKEEWSDKERREFKGKCVMYALETVKMSGEDTKSCVPSEVRKLVELEAEEYVKFIYDKRFN